MTCSRTTIMAGGWRRLALALCAAALPLLAAAQTTSFSSSYGSGYGIRGAEPSASGKYPVYVHIVGTGESYTSNWAMAAVEAAAAKGFVAASVEYANGTFGTCSTISGRAKSIFDAASASSAIAKLCARAKADCSKGVVTGGLSQGSIISVLSRNYDARVRASFGQGTGTTYATYNLESCMADGKHTQKGDRIRIINGERDMFVGGSESIARSQAQIVTGLSCPGQQSCFRSNGSGWYVVKDSQVYDLYADHCFMGYGGLYGNQCLGALVDPGYQYGNQPWQLNPTLDWLKTFVSR
jgi:hypothetical protein